VLGRKVGLFRDALTDYALSLKSANTLRSPQFAVSDAMLDDVWKRLTQRGVVMDRGIFDESAPVVRQLLSYDIARYVFGPEAEFRLRVQNDKAIATALQLATGATTQRALLDRAQAKQQQQLRSAGSE
jgi:hypothetical protein